MKTAAIIAIRPGQKPLTIPERRRRRDAMDGAIACLICLSCLFAAIGGGLVWYFS